MELIKIKKKELIEEIAKGVPLYYIRVWNKKENRWYKKKELEALFFLESVKKIIEENKDTLVEYLKKDSKGKEIEKEFTHIINITKKGGNNNGRDKDSDETMEIELTLNWWLEVAQKDAGLVGSHREGVNCGTVMGHRSLMGEIEWIKRIFLMASVKQYPVEIGGVFPCGLSLDENRNKLLDYVWIKKDEKNFIEGIQEKIEIVEKIIKARGIEGITESTIKEDGVDVSINIEREKAMLIYGQYWLYLIGMLQMARIVRYIGERDIDFWSLIEDIISSELKGNKTRKELLKEIDNEMGERPEPYKNIRKGKIEIDTFPISKLRRIRKYIKRKQRHVVVANFLGWIKTNQDKVNNVNQSKGE